VESSPSSIALRCATPKAYGGTAVELWWRQGGDGEDLFVGTLGYALRCWVVEGGTEGEGHGVM
jgi:hypothetical protein